MKIIKKANGNKTIKIDRKEWERIGKIAGWDDDFDDDSDDASELDDVTKKMVDELEVKIPEDKSAIPDEIKKEKKYVKRDPAEWAAIREEKERKKELEKKKKAVDKDFKGWEKDVYSKPPIE